MPWLPASMEKIRSKMKSLSIGQHFPLYKSKELICRYSRESNTKANIPIWPKFELRRDLIPVLVTSKFNEDPIKIEGTINWTRSNMGFRHSRASNSEMNSLILMEFELVRDFVAVLVTCKFDEAPIKSKVAILRTTFSPL